MAIAKRAGREPKSIMARTRSAKFRPAQVLASTSQGLLATDFYAATGMLKIGSAARMLGLSSAQLLETAGVAAIKNTGSTASLSKTSERRLRDMLEIVSRIAGWAGGGQQALAWYRAQPLPAFGSRTAEALVKEGKADAVRDYLDHIAVGGFA